MTKKPDIVVVGAGAFGGWTALYLLRGGARVTLVDAWGPGNSRASSGGETRIIRAAYGAEQHYTKMAARAFELWKQHQSDWKQQLFFPTGVLWMAHADDVYERDSLRGLKEAGIPFEQLGVNELAPRYPQINFDGVKWGIHESGSGYLLARHSARTVVDHFVSEGGDYRLASVQGKSLDSGKWNSLAISDGSSLVADQYVFACGSWLGKLFPLTVGPHFASTRQEIFFFGTPGGDSRFDEGSLPVWGDHGERFMYGIPGNQGRGFKLADDTRGPDFDPTSGERLVNEESIATMRGYLEYRFPGMKSAPLLESRVCQYENTVDGNFIVDRHPANSNVWIVGGGSGHGFKHGPALGEMTARLILEDDTADSVFRLDRFATHKAPRQT